MAETLRCTNAGCDFSTDSADALAIHELLAHPGFVEVPQDELPPLPVPMTFAPLEQFERAVGQLRCARSGGHVPSLRNPGVCCSCNASLEVARG